jgi:sulfoacetaldehyde acetyltransferase
MGAKVAQPERPSFAYVGDGAWGMSLHELLTAVRERIGVTAFVFNNSQWGAEKKNQVLWYADRYVGSNLTNPSFSAIARTMGARGEEVRHVDEIPGAVARATAAQQEGIPTVVEIFLSRELGEPFRRDAMKCPQRLLPKYAHLSVQSESPTGQVTDMERPPPIKSL